MIDTVDIDYMSVPISFESLNEDPIEINPLKKKKWARSANYSRRRMRPWSWHGRVWALIQSLGLIKVVTHIGIALWSLSPQCQDPLQQLLRFTCAHCWSAIQKCCNRWAGCVEEIDCAPPSGATIQDRVSKLSPTVSKKILTTSSLNVHLLDSVGALSTLFGTPVYR